LIENISGYRPKRIAKIVRKEEYYITKKLQGHPNIVSMMPMSKVGKKKACVVMEYCDNGNLQNYLDKVEDKDKVIRDITKAVGHMLSKGYVQTDLWRYRGEHLSNFFVRKYGDVVLGDFGGTEKITNKNLTELLKQMKIIIDYVNIY
jgi:RIO-like serine/threonine protein kinase